VRRRLIAICRMPKSTSRPGHFALDEKNDDVANSYRPLRNRL